MGASSSFLISWSTFYLSEFVIFLKKNLIIAKSVLKKYTTVGIKHKCFWSIEYMHMVYNSEGVRAYTVESKSSLKPCPLAT